MLKIFMNQIIYFLINKREEDTGLKLFNDSKVFIEYSNDMDDIYKKVERKTWIVFDYMIADILKIPLAFITQS